MFLVASYCMRPHEICDGDEAVQSEADVAAYSWNSTGAVSSQHPRDILADTPPTPSRGCYEDPCEDVARVGDFLFRP